MEDTMQGTGMSTGMHQTFLGAPIGLIFQILIIASIFLIVYWIFKNNSQSTKESAIEILRKKYVNGEITKKKFLELKKDIL
jgi:uncharacterized membrane protein